MIAELSRLLLEATIATSAAALATLVVRRPLLARLGASVGYSAWLLVPVALLAVLLPSPVRTTERLMAVRETIAAAGAATPPGITPAWSTTQVALLVWLAGAVTMALWLWRQQHAFHRTLRGRTRRADGLYQAPATQGLPAVVGVFRPAILLPADFDTRYDDTERALILCHERIHIRRLDLLANAFVALLRALFWFNPLLHYAATRFRRDQELACDERVIARHPQLRRRYADAMLKTHMAGTPLPIGCHWQDATPLKERIAMLKLHAPGKKRSLIGAGLLTLLSSVCGLTAWSAQPAREAAAAEAGYLVLITYEASGETRRFEIREAADKPFSLVMEAGGHRYDGRFKVREAGSDRIQIEAEIREDGQWVATPRLVVVPGKPGTFESGSEGGRLQKMTFVVTRSPGDQQAPASVASSPNIAEPNLYPPQAAQQSQGGMVRLKLDIAEDGSLTTMTVMQSEPFGVFDEAAMRLASRMTFNPRVVDGRPVPHSIVLPVRFDTPPPATPAADRRP